ncbi:MAG TPA: 4'-phosphopantetheinyl transferase superfamily protein [Leptolyngbyaceae cyanobacterium]
MGKASSAQSQTGNFGKNGERPQLEQRCFPIEPGHIHIWQFYLPQVREHLDGWVACLCQQERARMARFVFERDRIKYGLSRGGLRQLLARYMEQDPASLTFEYEAKGKPHLCVDGQRSSLQFNLSHSGDWVVYGVSCDRALGIDVEQVRPLRNLNNLAEHCLTPAECQDFSQVPAAQAQSKFFEYWTSKEAYLKATGQGLTHAMSNVQTDLVAAQILLEPHDPNFGPTWHLYRWIPDVGYAAALAYSGTPCKLQHLDYGSLSLP